ncbi:MAG: sulfatase [Planctomycetales bacterium]
MKFFRLLLWLILLSGSFASAADRPNIVYILADDLGWTDLACQGSKYYETPNIDRLAKQGIRFTRYYNCQNCAPTRAVLMSGRYPPRTGIYTVSTLERGQPSDRKMNVPRNEINLPLDIPILPQALKQAGYATAMFGKWHLGQQGQYHPSQRGFDAALVSAGKHFDFETSPPVAVPQGTYLADYLTDRAVDFIQRHKDKPFFLYLPHFGVHTPYQAKPDYIARWKQKPPAGTHFDPVYAAMIQSVDESVGKILATLDQLKLADNTVVIFSSDNGGVGGYQSTEPPGPKPVPTDNAPLKGGKGTLYEGGLRVPFIVRWPGVTPPEATCDTPVAHIDIYPTLIDIAHAARPNNAILDGVSFLPLLRDPHATLNRPAIYWHFPGYLESYVSKTGWRTTPVGAIHAGDWKLLQFFEDNHVELYNLTDDIGEKHNLAAQSPEKAKELLTLLAAWRKEIHAAMPTLK